MRLHANFVKNVYLNCKHHAKCTFLRMKYVTSNCFVDCYTNLPMYKFHIVQEEWPCFNNIIIIQKKFAKDYVDNKMAKKC